MHALTILSIIVISLMISAYFSACETAITVASKAKFHQLAKEGNPRAIIIRDLQQKLGLVISVLLMCMTMINAGAVSLATDFLSDIWGKDVMGTICTTMIMGPVLLVYVEVMPKMVALHNPEKILMGSARFIRFMFTFFQPVNKTINWLARNTLSLVGIQPTGGNDLYSSIEELRGVIDLHKGPGQDVQQERAMLKSILDLGSVHVDEIMVHRKNVTMINAGDPPAVIIDQVLSCPFTRLPIWQDDPDNIVGLINAKALLRAVKAYHGKVDDLDITSIATKPWFIPESTDLLEQLQAFRHRREHFAIVVDEYGTLMGIVTLEDILEEIVGDIADEHDIAVKGVRPQADGSYIIDGSVTIRDLNRQFDWELPDDLASTIAGLLLYQVRLIPKVGQVFMLHGFRLEVLRRQRNQITLIKITPPEPMSVQAD
ncbi:MAG: CNNM domain-containing protein [Alphaproteobacteria bacterium]|nr:CNNM domain-containing protein [Alphaproteobacteria bacterium]